MIGNKEVVTVSGSTKVIKENNAKCGKREGEMGIVDIWSKNI